MATMEQAARGSGVYGMPFIRSNCTAIGVSAFQMVRNLDILAPDKYSALFDRLQDIQHLIDAELTTDRGPSDSPPVMRLADVDCHHRGERSPT